MLSRLSSIVRFVSRHPGLLLVLLGVAGEVIFDWPETHGPLAWVRRLCSGILVFGLVVEFFEAAESDKQVADLTRQTAIAQKQIAEISLEVAKAHQAVADAQAKAAEANKAAAEAHERATLLERASGELKKEAAQGRLELEQVKSKQLPRFLSPEQTV